MEFDVVVATRNRPDLLAPTLRSILAQDRLPARLIIVDSSDDPAPVREVVQQASANKPVVATAVHSGPGLTRQRNVGLARVEAPVVMFPDDDVIWAPGATEAVMRIYERDEQHRIAGVALQEVRTPPEGYPEVEQNRQSKNLSTELIYRFSPLRARLERFVQENPIILRGRQLLDEQLAGNPAPQWLRDVHAHPIPAMIGFKMTFRTDAIRASGFDEELCPYSVYEDNDACLSAQRHGILVEAEDALVFHNRAPGGRAPRIATGVMLLLNPTYITCKHSPVGSSARKAIPKYLKLRGLQYRLRARGEVGKARLEGYRRAMKHMPRLLEAEGDELRQRYIEAIRASTAD